MTRARLKNKANRTNKEEDLIAYKKQRNYCTKLNKISKKEKFKNLNCNGIENTKRFLKFLNHYFLINITRVAKKSRYSKMKILCQMI